VKTISPSIVVAAGAICWRIVDGKLRILLVHRAAHQDVSLPKGKVDPGETPPQTAVREIAEETGLQVALGVPLTTIGYTLSDGREKVVHYWAAEVDDDMRAASTFRSNAEIGSLEWVGLGAARKKLSYERDRDVIDRFEELVDAGTLKTFALIVLRHAKAVPPASWDGPDATRPLLHRGLDQAANIAPAVAAWRPARILSSPAARCLATVEPLAALTGLPVKQVVGISQDAYEDGTATVAKTIAKRVAKRETVVLCTHGPLLAEIIRSAAKATNTPMDDTLARSGMLSTGEFTVLHLSLSGPDTGSELVAFETHGPLAG
jgi:8-oxo-(d)GTP phosphatase